MRRMLDLKGCLEIRGIVQTSLLARYLYELCRDFSRAYGAVP